MSVLIFVIALAILILAHEFGHFLFAKLSGMRVDEFGIGFPPRLFSKQIGETKYSINLIPFGGFVKIFGEDPQAGETDLRAFGAKSKWKQISVLAAGVLFNMLLAWFLFAGALFVGMPTSGSALTNGSEVQEQKLIVVSVSPDSPAETAGIKSGDEILFVESNGKKIQNEELTPESFQETILNGQGEAVTILYKDKRSESAHSVVLTPSFDVIPDRPVVGLATDRVGIVKLPAHKAIWSGLVMTLSVFKEVTVGLGKLIVGSFQGTAHIKDVTGPVGIVGFIGDASSLGFVYLVSFVAFISVNLAVINLIPLPALDGGRILFVIIEAIRGKNISPKVANSLNFIGFVLLMALMLVVTYNDIVRLF